MSTAGKLATGNKQENASLMPSTAEHAVGKKDEKKHATEAKRTKSNMQPVKKDEKKHATGVKRSKSNMHKFLQSK